MQALVGVTHQAEIRTAKRPTRVLLFELRLHTFSAFIKHFVLFIISKNFCTIYIILFIIFYVLRIICFISVISKLYTFMFHICSSFHT